MKNSNSFGIIKENLKTIRQLCVSPGRIIVYVIFLLATAFININLLPGLFTTPAQSWFGADGIYSIMYIIISVCILAAIFILTPMEFRNANTKKSTEIPASESDELPSEPTSSESVDSRGVSFFQRFISVCIPFFLYLVIQTLIFVGIALKSREFTISVFEILLSGFGLFINLIISELICALLYCATKTVRWYVAGFAALLFAPAIIGFGCLGIYNNMPLLPNSNLNILEMVIFLAPISSLLNRPLITVLVLCSVSAFCIGLTIPLRKRNIILNLSWVSNAYKTVTIFALALSLGFLTLGKDYTLSTQRVLIFGGCSLALALILTYFAFRKNKLIPRIAITSVCIVAFTLAIFLGIPAFSKIQSYDIPEKADIKKIEIFIDTFENYETEEYFGDCLELHKMLLDKFQEGVSLDNSIQPYKEPECIAELWDDVYFIYTLKNGDIFYRDYRGLRDNSFDEFYISYMKSELYAASLKVPMTENLKIEYFSGAKEGKSCTLSATQAATLLDTYCNELHNAENSSFYEKCTEIRLVNFNEYMDRVIYIPISFNKTQSLIISYFGGEAAG